MAESENMKLRNLEQKDTLLMLEWMHDEAVVRDMQTMFTGKTRKDCEEFIACSRTNKDNLHLAIVNDEDIYMGTVSLKHISIGDTAEFGIVMRGQAMGKGYAQWAMEEIMNIGFRKLKLKRIFWCAKPQNERALRFYDKNGYKRLEVLNQKTANMLCEKGIYNEEQIKSYVWYQYEGNDNLKMN